MFYLKCRAEAQKAIGLQKAQALAHCHAGRYSQTDSRKALGSLNDLVRCYTTMVEE
jgi:hypothetical protein